MLGLRRRSAIPLFLVACCHGVLLYFISKYCDAKDDLDSFQSSVIIFASAIILIYLSKDYCTSLWNLKYDGPFSFPFLGCAHHIVAKGTMQDSVQYLLDQYKRKGKNTNDAIVELVMPPSYQHAIISNNIAFNKMAIQRTTERGVLDPSNPNFHDFFLWVRLQGKTDIDLLTLSGPKWKARRKMVQPAFGQKHIMNLLKPISNITHELIQHRLEPRAQQGDDADKDLSVDILAESRLYGLEVVFRTSLGLSMNLLRDPEAGQWIIDAFGETTKAFSKYLYDPFIYFKVELFPSIGWNKDEIKRRENMARVRQFTETVVQKEMAQVKSLEKQNEVSTTNGDNKTNGKMEGRTVDSLMGLLIRTSLDYPDELPYEALVNELMSFLFAGLDTTAVTLSVALYYIATHAKCQERVHREIDDALESYYKENGTSNNNKDDRFKTVDLAHVLQCYALPYLAACIREAQRLQPIGPILMRRMEQDLTFTNKDRDDDDDEMTTVSMKKGSRLFVPVYSIHRNEKQYPNPDEFRPERWIETTENGTEKLKPITPGYFYAFGGGPKMCVGLQLAEKQVKLEALGILGKFHVESLEEMVIQDNFITGPGSVPVKLTKRG